MCFAVGLMFALSLLIRYIVSWFYHVVFIFMILFVFQLSLYILILSMRFTTGLIFTIAKNVIILIRPDLFSFPCFGLTVLSTLLQSGIIFVHSNESQNVNKLVE